MANHEIEPFPEEISPNQARINILSQRMQMLYDNGLDDDQVCEAITHLRDRLFSAIDEKIDIEIAQKGKEVVIKCPKR